MNVFMKRSLQIGTVIRIGMISCIYHIMALTNLEEETLCMYLVRKDTMESAFRPCKLEISIWTGLYTSKTSKGISN